MKVTTMVKSILFGAAMIIGLQLMAPKAEAATVCAIDCVKLKAAYALLVKKFGVNSKIAKTAKAYYDKVCPAADPTTFECIVRDQFNSANVSLGIDGSGTLINVLFPDRTVCTTQSACLTIASQKFTVISAVTTSRCSAASDPTVIKLDAAQLQTKISALP